jgi:Na+/proline symporter
MSSLDSFANSASAYFVSDIYKALFRPEASDKELLVMSYFGTFALFAVGITIGIFTDSINHVWSWVITCSLITTLLGTLLTQPTTTQVLTHFYQKTRPYGFWGTIAANAPEAVRVSIRREGKRDRLLLPIAVIWQLSLLWSVVSLLSKAWQYFIPVACVLTATSLALYFLWYRHLDDAKAEV